MKAFKYIYLFHAFYYVLTGVWPLVHVTSFMAVTGPKIDIWLVRVVGVLVTAIGVSILIAILKNEIRIQTAVLAIISSLGLAVSDIFYVVNGTIPPIYLADAMVEIFLATVWAIAVFKKEYK